MRDGPASSRSRWVAAAVAIGALAYAAASYALMNRPQDSAWSLALVIGPLLVVTAMWAWNAGHRMLAVAGGLGVVVLGFVLLGLQGGEGQGVPSRWLYLAQHAGVHLALGAWFGATLRPGAEPLVTALARRVHDLTPVLTVAFFVGEYVLRYWLHPEFERVSIQRALQAYRSHTGDAARPPQDRPRP